MRCMQWPPIFASNIIGPSFPSSSPKGGKKISGLGEKLCAATFCCFVAKDARVGENSREEFARWRRYGENADECRSFKSGARGESGLFD
ncbi:hypothetical protein Tco_1372954 [Tanacetum coccineum]